MMETNQSHRDVDVLILGAGLSGIGAACHLQKDCADTTFAILERRQAMGGTWDLFRYPGIRSDSDMFSFGYDFRPWNELKVLAEDRLSVTIFVILPMNMGSANIFAMA